jgi:hypothetical protein
MTEKSDKNRIFPVIHAQTERAQRSGGEPLRRFQQNRPQPQKKQK